MCGRRDAVLPRNVQKDPETSLAWTLKDQVVRRGKVYYAKLARGKATFIAPRMIPHFHAIWGVRPSQERAAAELAARAVLKVLRREWEMASSDLRTESGVTERAAFTRALDELQAAMIVVPSEAVYLPKFTYLWTLAIGRFPDLLSERVRRESPCARSRAAFCRARGMTVRGELARVTGLSRPEAGRGNRALVAEGCAEMLSPGTYALVNERLRARQLKCDYCALRSVRLQRGQEEHRCVFFLLPRLLVAAAGPAAAQPFANAKTSLAGYTAADYRAAQGVREPVRLQGRRRHHDSGARGGGDGGHAAALPRRRRHRARGRVRGQPARPLEPPLLHDRQRRPCRRCARRRRPMPIGPPA